MGIQIGTTTARRLANQLAIATAAAEVFGDALNSIFKLSIEISVDQEGESVYVGAVNRHQIQRKDGLIWEDRRTSLHELTAWEHKGGVVTLRCGEHDPPPIVSGREWPSWREAFEEFKRAVEQDNLLNFRDKNPGDK